MVPFQHRFQAGDMVKLISNLESTGFVSPGKTYPGFATVTFLSGSYAGTSLQINTHELIGVDDIISEDEDRPVVLAIAPVVEVEPPAIEGPVIKIASINKKWSKTEIVAMIKVKPGAVDRGITCLNKHSQLLPEKSRPFVAYYAEYVASGGSLSGRHLFNARRTCLFSAAILVSAANGEI